MEITYNMAAKRLGLTVRELCALIGNGLNMVGRYRDGFLGTARSTRIHRWICYNPENDPKEVIRSYLMYWTHDGINDQHRLRHLQNIAKRTLGPDGYLAWSIAMKERHPHLYE